MVKASERGSAFVPLKRKDLDLVFSLQHERTVARDNTVSFANCNWQIERAELQDIQGLSPVESQANFMVVRSEIDPKRVFNELLKRDILIRDVSSYPMLAEYFRISVGTPEENDHLIEALKQIFQ